VLGVPEPPAAKLRSRKFTVNLADPCAMELARTSGRAGFRVAHTTNVCGSCVLGSTPLGRSSATNARTELGATRSIPGWCFTFAACRSRRPTAGAATRETAPARRRERRATGNKGVYNAKTRKATQTPHPQHQSNAVNPRGVSPPLFVVTQQRGAASKSSSASPSWSGNHGGVAANPLVRVASCVQHVSGSPGTRAMRY
jgi:hypothetical protein